MTKLFYFMMIGLFSFSSIAREAGKVIFVRGKVHYRTKSIKTIRTTKGMVFDEKGLFTTSKRSLIILSLNDGSKIKLGPSSKIYINNLITNKKPTTTSLLRGDAFFSVIKNRLTNKVKFKVRTKTAALGVRGTTFYISYGKDKINKDIWMCVKEGLVSVRAKHVKRKTYVKSGEGVQVANSSSISKPKQLAWTSKLNWNMDPLKGKVLNKLNIEEAYFDVLDQDYD